MLKNAFTKLAVIAAVGALSQAAMAADGTVNFTGKITDSICSVAPESVNMTVPLGKVSKNAFPAVGSGSTVAKFTINLRDCPAGTNKAKVTFSGAGVPGNIAAAEGLLKVNNSGSTVEAAKGVGIEIGDANGLKIPLGAASSEYILGAGDNNLKFQARYVSFFPVTPTAPSTDALTAGPADGTAQFSIAYN